MSRNTSRKAVRLFAAAAMVAVTTTVGVTVTVSPALAYPTNCATGYLSSPDGFTAVCFDGGGLHRAEVYCVNEYNKGYWRYGAWQPNDIWSTIYCTSSYPHRTNQRIGKQ